MQFVKTNDGTNTLYSTQYQQHFHNVKDGALEESLNKHIIPALKYHQDKKELVILDICFGLGYNTLATLYYIILHNLDIKVTIYSPELDENLVNTLQQFKYPSQFDSLKHIINELSKKYFYEDEKIKIEISIIDARVYLKNLRKQNILFDIVYQDPFSSDTNKALWTKEYFSDIYKLLKDDAIITTYSIATPVRLSIYFNNLTIYEYYNKLKTKSTIALKRKEDILNLDVKYIDMKLKQQRNPQAKALVD